MTQPSVKLSANENCYGCSPLALEAILNNYKQAHVYPEVFAASLKDRLAKEYNVSDKNIVVGAGSVNIIDALIRTFVKENEEVLTFEKSFVAYAQLAGFHNRKCVFAPLSDFRCVPNNILPFVTDKTKLIFIANPNNPTGTIITHDELEGLLKNIPSTITVVIDEAYSEYVTDKAFPNSLLLQQTYPNLIILHSFSKIHGLAGLRIGYAIAELSRAQVLNNTQIPFSLHYLSCASAIAALNDKTFVAQSAKANAEQGHYLHTELRKLGVNSIATQANFIYIWFTTDDEKLKIYNLLQENGILICDMKVFGQEKSLRITIGDKTTNERIVGVLKG